MTTPEQGEAVNPLTPDDEQSFRAEAARREAGDTSWTTHSVRRLLATLDAARLPARLSESPQEPEPGRRGRCA